MSSDEGDALIRNSNQSSAVEIADGFFVDFLRYAKLLGDSLGRTLVA